MPIEFIIKLLAISNVWHSALSLHKPVSYLDQTKQQFDAIHLWRLLYCPALEKQVLAHSHLRYHTVFTHIPKGDCYNVLGMLLGGSFAYNVVFWADIHHQSWCRCVVLHSPVYAECCHLYSFIPLCLRPAVCGYQYSQIQESIVFTCFNQQTNYFLPMATGWKSKPQYLCHTTLCKWMHPQTFAWAAFPPKHLPLPSFDRGGLLLSLQLAWIFPAKHTLPTWTSACKW